MTSFALLETSLHKPLICVRTIEPTRSPFSEKDVSLIIMSKIAKAGIIEPLGAISSLSFDVQLEHKNNVIIVLY